MATIQLATEVISSVVNEGADWYFTLNELSEGNIYAAVGFLPFVPGVLGKANRVFLRKGDHLVEIRADTLRRLEEAAKAGKLDEVVEELRSKAPISFSSDAGRILGEAWKNIGQLRSYLQRQGVGLVADGDTILDALSVGGKVENAAFAQRGSGLFIILRKGATKREVMHEIGHMLTWKKHGREYWELSEAARERLASRFVRDSSLWRRLLPEEQWAELERILSGL